LGDKGEGVQFSPAGGALMDVAEHHRLFASGEQPEGH
jgi:hypothetical protein